MYDKDKKVYISNCYENDVLEIYRNLAIGVSSENGKQTCKRSQCNECRCEAAGLSEKLLTPSSMWQVGDNYFNSKYKLLLVGKAARGEPGDGLSFSDGSVMIDTTKYFEELKNRSWAYWRYSRDLLQKLYPESENAWEYVAFTNMVKCNSSYGQDTTTLLRKNNCIEIIKSEIKYLKPQNIVFYTGWYYDNQIKAIFEKYQDLECDIEVNVGKYNMPLWHFTAELCGQKINGIRVAHPQGKNKEKFIRAIKDRLIF